jgi:hypothetical protein
VEDERLRIPPGVERPSSPPRGLGRHVHLLHA